MLNVPSRRMREILINILVQKSFAKVIKWAREEKYTKEVLEGNEKGN